MSCRRAVSRSRCSRARREQPARRPSPWLHVEASRCVVESAAALLRVPPRSTPVSGASARSRSVYDYDAIARVDEPREIAAGPPSFWRYGDLLPVAVTAPVDLGTGFTPLVRADRLAAELGLGEVWLKNDTRNPTNSFKDRVVAIALSKALEFGFKVAACASTGQPRELGRRARRARRPAQLRVHPVEPRAGQDRHHRRSTAATSSRSTATTTT